MNQLNGAILNKDTGLVDYVYTGEHKKKIASMCNLMPGIFNADDVRAGKLADVNVLFSTWGFPALTEEEIGKMPNLKAVFYAAGATDYFARPYFAKKIPVVSAWRMNAVPVAEFCEAEIVLALKGFYRNTYMYRKTKDFKAAHDLIGPGIYEETVALIGAGAISTLVKDMLEKMHHLKVIVVPSRPERCTMSITEAFATAQVISNHLPNRDDNIHVIGRREFEAMRPGAVFINTGRGAQVDEEAMVDVLRKRTDLTAVLDVTDPEPPAQDSPLFELPNIILTTHIAGSLNNEVHRMAECIISEFDNYLNGRPLQHEVQESMLLTSGK